MSGHWRFFVAACFFASLSTSPAFSNALTDLFNPAPKEAEAPAPAPPAAAAAAKEACASRPGSSAAPGQHWFYRVDGDRKCWFQRAERAVSVKKLVRHYASKRPAVAPEENKIALHNRTVLDARDQLLSAAPADAPQPTAPVPNVVDKASVAANEAATIAPAAPVAAQPAIDQLTPDGAAPDRATPHQVDVEMLLADSSLDKDTKASSVPAAAPAAPSVPDADEGHWGSTTTRAGAMLIALGFVFLLGSLLVSRFLDSRVMSIRRS